MNFSFDVPLIFPSEAVIYRLDLEAMRADPDGAGELTSGIDPDYREPVLVPSANRIGTLNRIEMAAVTVPAQVDTESLERLQMAAPGDESAGVLILTMKFADLEELGLLDPVTFNPLLKRARLDAIQKDGETVYQFPNPPGLFVDQMTPSFGFGGKRDLLTVRLSTRDRA